MFTLLRRMTHIAENSIHTFTNYEHALKILYSLQSNAAYKKNVVHTPKKLDVTLNYLIKSGITLEELNKLSIIHVAGTKGKGSTCAFTESILREHGFSTGLFTSPHLVTVRERIRVNGEPISESLFSSFFFKVYNKLEKLKNTESDMPMYFQFLTILMFNIFLELKVDVAVIEVGIGGELDCTNIIKNPVCAGITSLGLEHTQLLGDTIEKIAYQKSGIFKPNTIAFSVPQQKEAIEILKKRAQERKCTLNIVKPLDVFKRYGNKSMNLGINSKVQKYNASLAIELATTWMNSQNKILEDIEFNIQNYDPNSYNKRHFSKHEITKESAEKISKGLSLCRWPGRTQILSSSIADFYLDGAHTLESIRCCIRWFADSISTKSGKRYLIFNTTGERDSTILLSNLKSLNFDRAYFVPNDPGVPTIDSYCDSNEMKEAQYKRCKIHCEIWGNGSYNANNISQIIDLLRKEHDVTNEIEKPQILVTGSLHLVGAVLYILDPNLTMSTDI